MFFHRTQLFSIVIFSAVSFLLFHSSSQLQAPHDYPLFDSNYFHNSYYSIIKRKRLRQGNIKSVQVYDDMACVQQCLWMRENGCVSVNFKKQPTKGLHQCDLLAVNGNAVEPSAMKDDLDFDHIILEYTTFSSCAEIYKINGKSSGVYLIRASPSLPVQVYCDMVTSGGGWIVIQKRIDGSVDFYRDWDEYKKGFGNKLGEYWLGLDTIHAMTSEGSYRLRVDLEDFEGNTRYAEYETFYVADERDNYRLTVGGYKGDAGNSLFYQTNCQFTTKERDNDNYSLNCAVSFSGAWWYKSCHKTNLNGLYLRGATTHHAKGVVWKDWKGHDYSLKRAEMKIKAK